MKNDRALVWLTYTVIFCLIGCSSPTNPTEASQLPTASLNPTATETSLPPTATLEPTATKTPKPTWTPRPQGTFKGCIYYQGELVEGKIEFFNESDLVKAIKVDSSGCATIQLSPGNYEVFGSHRKGSCATIDGCWSDYLTFVMEPDGLIEMDFEIKYPNE